MNQYQKQNAVPHTSDAYFVKGLIGSDEILDDDRKHIAFIGRSNVGKSSTINAILGRNSLVRSSARPGKTTEINFFSVGSDKYFVDLPGYGFARMGERQREKLRKLILWYLLHAEVRNRVTFVILDAKVGMTDFDAQILNTLAENNEQVHIILNKIDKLNQKEAHQQITALQARTDAPIMVCSAVTKQGIAEVWKTIFE